MPQTSISFFEFLNVEDTLSLEKLPHDEVQICDRHNEAEDNSSNYAGAGVDNAVEHVGSKIAGDECRHDRDHELHDEQHVGVELFDCKEFKNNITP